MTERERRAFQTRAAEREMYGRMAAVAVLADVVKLNFMVLRPAFTTKDLQRMLSLRCTACEYRWIAPTGGRCPKCGHARTAVLEERLNVLPRV